MDGLTAMSPIHRPLNHVFSPNFRKFAPHSRSWICGCRCALKYGAGPYDLSPGAAPRPCLRV